jgi:hypothetical protein
MQRLKAWKVCREHTVRMKKWEGCTLVWVLRVHNPMGVGKAERRA